MIWLANPLGWDWFEPLALVGPPLFPIQNGGLGDVRDCPPGLLAEVVLPKVIYRQD